MLFRKLSSICLQVLFNNISKLHLITSNFTIITRRKLHHILFMSYLENRLQLLFNNILNIAFMSPIDEITAETLLVSAQLALVHHCRLYFLREKGF